MKSNTEALKKKSVRTALRSRVSLIALVAASFAPTPSAHAACGIELDPGAVNFINVLTPYDCVIIDDPVSANVDVYADVGDISVTGVPIGEIFTVHDEALVGEINVNSGTIDTLRILGGLGGSGLAGLDAAYSTIGIIENAGSIGDAPVGVSLAYSDVANGIVNTAGGIIAGTSAAIGMIGSTVGMISNSGTIAGGWAGIYGVDSSMQGLVNAEEGVILGAVGSPGSIIPLPSAGVFVGGEDSSLFGDLTNHGTIAGYSGGFIFVGERFEGDIVNTGLIQANLGSGGLRIGGETGLSIDTIGLNTNTEHFIGNFQNSGVIDGGEDIGVIFNVGTIDGSDSRSEISNHGSILGGVWIEAQTAYVELTNHKNGLIVGDDSGIYVHAGSWDGNVTNAGIVLGDDVGIRIDADPFFAGKIFEFGQVNTAETTCSFFFCLASSTFTGNVVNTGLIQGEDIGASIAVNEFFGSIINHGTIIAADGEDGGETLLATSGEDSVGLRVGDGGSVFSTIFENDFTGSIINTGLIQGGDGVQIDLSTFNGNEDGFLNEGSILGTTGVGLSINVEVWNGRISNTGRIEGAQTGLLINAGTIFGDVINDGEIVGGALTTGLHIASSVMYGDIENNDLLSAPGNALHLEIDDLYGNVENAGTIEATSPFGVAVRLEQLNDPSGYMDGSLINSGLIDGGGEGTGIELEDFAIAGALRNTGGVIRGDIAIDTGDASGATWIENVEGGLIEGQLRLSTYHGDVFYGEDGGVVGQILGVGGEGGYDDAVLVANGTQFLIGGARSLNSFDVEDGGVMLLGTDDEGVDGSGFESEDINSVSVFAGGRIYLDDNTLLQSDFYSQSSDGEITFFLTTDESTHGVVNAIDTAELDGTISVYLDAASFSGSTQTEYEYHDVIVAGNARTGTFANGYIANNPYFFDLEVVEDENTIDLLVTRIPFTTLNCSNSTENNAALAAMLEAAFANGGLTPEQLELYEAILGSEDGCEAAQKYSDLSGLPFDFIAFQLDGPFKKMVGARIDSGRATGCLVAGSGGCFTRYAADTTGGSTVMTDATPGDDPFGWLRTGVRKTGSTGVWGRGVGVWGETDGNGVVGAPGSEYDQHGAIVGVDHVVSAEFLVGAAAQYTHTDIEFPGHVDRVQVNSYEFGSYLSWGDTMGYVNANLSYIWHDFDASRLVLGLPTIGKFGGSTLSAYTEIGRIYESGGWRLQPTLALSFASLSTDGYTEEGASPSRLVVKESGFDSLKTILGGRFAYPVELKSGRLMVPEVRVSWSHELMDNSAEFEARLFSFPDIAASYFVTQGAEADRDAVILGAGMNAPVSDRALLYLDYDATLSSDQESQTVSGGLRILW